MNGSAAQVSCNNPSPFVHPTNGTLFLACTWKLYRSSPAGAGPADAGFTWGDPIAITGEGGRPLGTWEDPFLWIDRRGHFHILSHVYRSAPYPVNPIAGHAFSEQGTDWTFSGTQPYGNVVARAGGASETFATLERCVHFGLDSGHLPARWALRIVIHPPGGAPFWGAHRWHTC